MLLAGCADDPEAPPAQVTVPARDDTPPSARIALTTAGGDARAETVQLPEGARAAEVELDALRCLPSGAARWPHPGRAIAAAMGARLRCAGSWGEAINGSGLEAVTPHLRFRWAFQ